MQKQPNPTRILYVKFYSPAKHFFLLLFKDTFAATQEVANEDAITESTTQEEHATTEGFSTSPNTIQDLDITKFSLLRDPTAEVQSIQTIRLTQHLHHQISKSPKIFTPLNELLQRYPTNPRDCRN